MRKNIVAGNWKMNNDLAATKTLISELIELNKTSDAEVMIAPTFVNLMEASKLLRETSIRVASQNMHYAESGAFTGEVSAKMLKAIGVNTVILGHSERREYFHEDDLILKQKVDKALQESMEVIFCFGEQLDDRNSDHHFKVVERQIKNALFHLPSSSWESVVLAYEPVWAIGTGQTASPEQAQEMHAYIRKLVGERYDISTSEKVSILYGGSVKPENSEEIFGKLDVDGGLIGGAALDAKSFMAIINAF
jgi:triosephosphate isomerase (TIM)